MMFYILIFCFSFVGISTSLTVTEEVMSFIMGCGAGERQGRSQIPMSRTDIDPETGTTVQEVTMLDIASMRDMLLETVESQEAVNYIVSMVEKTLHSQQDLIARRGCTNVQVEVPPQEVKGLAETIQAVVQQNNYQLLEQVNTLFSFKLNSFYQEVETLLNGKLEEIQILNKESQQVVNVEVPVVTPVIEEPFVEQQATDQSNKINTLKEEAVVKTEEVHLSEKDTVESTQREEPMRIAEEKDTANDNLNVELPKPVIPEKLRTKIAENALIIEEEEVFSAAEPEPEPEGDAVPEPEKEPSKKPKQEIIHNPSPKVAEEPEPEPEGDDVPEPETEPSKKPRNEIIQKQSPKVAAEPEPEPEAYPEADSDVEPEHAPTKPLKPEPLIKTDNVRRPSLGSAPSIKSRVPARRINLRPRPNNVPKEENVEEFDAEEANAEEDTPKVEEERSTDPRRRRMEAMLAQRRKAASRFREG